MRLLETIVTDQPNGNLTVIDAAARGARAASIAIKQTAAPGTGTFEIDDILTTSAGNQVFRIAQFYSPTPSANQPDNVLTYLIGNRLQLTNNTGAAVRSIVSLYDELTTPPQGTYLAFFQSSTLAALATFTSTNNSLFRATQAAVTVTANRAYTINIDSAADNALTWIPLVTISIAAAAGGPLAFPFQIGGVLYRIRLTNDDAALLMTYQINLRAWY